VNSLTPHTREQQVTLVVPWICEADQACIYPGGVTFKEQEGQVPNLAQEGTT
jgi:hypothetical protein